MLRYSLYFFFIILADDCASFENITEKKNKKLFLENFQEQTIPVTPKDKKRFYDCPESSDINNTGLPMPILNKEFDYFSETKYPNLHTGLTEQNNLPVLVSFFSSTPPNEYKEKVIVTFRGDTRGYHKSRVSKPYLNYMKTYRNKDIIFFLDNLHYRNENSRDLATSDLIYMCHSRKYLGKMMSANWEAVLNGNGWKLLNRFFPPNQKFELFAYSNGTLPRTEFISRKYKEGFEPDFYKVQNQKDFLDLYVQNTELKHKESKNVHGILDIEGNYFFGKPYWDLLAFIKEVIEPDSNRYYFAIVSVTEKNAYPNHALMTLALGLKGIEEESGVVRFTNEKGNVVIDIIPKDKPPFYESQGYNLYVINPFQRHVNPKRVKFAHLDIIPYAMKRFQKNEWHEKLVSK